LREHLRTFLRGSFARLDDDLLGGGDGLLRLGFPDAGAASRASAIILFAVSLASVKVFWRSTSVLASSALILSAPARLSAIFLPAFRKHHSDPLEGEFIQHEENQREAD